MSQSLYGAKFIHTAQRLYVTKFKIAKFERNKVYTNKVNTQQSLYVTKFMRNKVYNSKIYHTYTPLTLTHT
jgi:hypothetical protein